MFAQLGDELGMEGMLDPVQVGRANEPINERADRVFHQRDRVAHPGVVDGSADQWRQTTGLVVSCRTTFGYTVACRQPSGELGQRGHFGYFARVFDRRLDGQAINSFIVPNNLAGCADVDRLRLPSRPDGHDPTGHLGPETRRRDAHGRSLAPSTSRRGPTTALRCVAPSWNSR